MTMIRDEILRDLRAKFPYTAIKLVDAGREIGLAPGTTYNLTSLGTFPLPLIQHAQKRCVSVYALADYLAAASGYQDAPESPPGQPVKRRPGRPRKAEQLARQRDPLTTDFLNGKADFEGVAK